MASPQENPASAPSEKSTLLVSRLRATLDTQWGKFDKSLPALKIIDGDYITMKAGYEGLKSDLIKISNDEDLKKDTTIQNKLDEFLIKIAKHLTDTKRDRSYDAVLTETQSQVTALRSEIYGKSALVVAGAATVATASVGDVGAVADSAQKELQKSTGVFRGWIEKKTNEPGMMGDIFRELKKKALELLKEVAEPPKSGWLESPGANIMYMIKKWFAPILAGIFGVSILDTPSKPPESSGGAGEKPGENAEQIAKNALITTSYKGFTRIFARPTLDPKKKENVFTHANIDQLITVQSFRDAKYKDILSLHTKYANASDKSGLKKDLNISDDKISADMIAFVISRIATGKGNEFIEKHALPGQNKDTIKVSDIFSKLHKNIHIGAKFDNLKPSKPITGPTDFMDYLGEVGGKIDLPLSGADGVMGHPDYKETIATLGITSSMAGYVIDTKDTDINTISSQTIKESTISDEAGKEGMKKLLDFWNKFQVTLAEKFSFGNKDKYLEYFKKHGVGIGDVFRMYLVTGGNPSFNGLNGTQEAYIYMKLWSILGKDPEFRGQYFNQPLITALFEEGSNIKISPEAKHVLSTLFANVLEETMNKMGGFMLEFWTTLTTEQKIIFTGTVGAGLVALWYLKPVKWIGVGITATVIAGSIGLAIALMWPNQQKIKIKDKEYTPKELQDKLVNGVESAAK